MKKEKYILEKSRLSILVEALRTAKKIAEEEYWKVTGKLEIIEELLRKY